MSFVYGSPSMSPRVAAAAAEADASCMRASLSPSPVAFASPVGDMIHRNNTHHTDFAARTAVPPSMPGVVVGEVTTAPSLGASNVAHETAVAAQMVRETQAVREAHMAGAAAANAAAQQAAAAAKADAANAIAARDAAMAADAVARANYVAGVTAADTARSAAHGVAGADAMNCHNAARTAAISNAGAMDAAIHAGLMTTNIVSNATASDVCIRASLSPRVSNYLKAPVVGSPMVGSPSPVACYTNSPTFLTHRSPRAFP